MDIIKKFFQFAMGNVIILFIGFITTPIITHLVSPEDLGKYSLFNTIGNLCALICMMGTDQAFIRFYYEETECSRVKLSKVFLRFCLINSIILCVCFWVLKSWISTMVIGTDSYLLIMGLCTFVLFNIIYNVVLLQLRVEQKLNMYNVIHTLQKLFYLIFAVCIYRKGFYGLMSAIAMAYFFAGMLGMVLEKKVWLFSKTQKITLRHNFKEILFFGFPIFFSSIIAWVFQASDKIMLKIFSDFRELGIYASAADIIILLNAVQSAFATFWIPVAYEQYLKEPDNTEFFTKANQIISLTMFSIAVVLIMTKDVLGFVLGSSYEEAVYIFPFLVFMPIMYTISETTVLGINFKKKTIYHIWISIIASASNIALNALLIPLYGAKGAAIGTGLAYFVYWGGRTAFSLKCFKVNYSLKEFFLSSALVYGYAAYSSFNHINMFILICGIFLLAIMCFLYRKIFIEIYKKAKNNTRRRV